MTSQTSWLKQSVQQFFGNYNWLGKPLETETGYVNGKLLSLTMPVSEFFRAISWDGIPEVGAMPPPPPSPVIVVNESAEVTIDDLFDLF